MKYLGDRMRLISCENCGIVIDIDRIKEPLIYNEDGTVDISKCRWDGVNHIPTIECPCCKKNISYSDGLL
jgi:primosomal protein N'